MAAQQEFLPKEPLDLPRTHEEVPAHVGQAIDQISQSREVKTLLSWHAPGRPFRERNREYFINMTIIMMVFVVLAFLFKEFMLIPVVISLGFLAYALATVPPHDFHYRFSTEGITVEDHFYLWQELYDFYFKRQEHQTVLHIRTKALFPGAITMTLGEMSQEHVKSVLLPYLPYREHVELTFTEKAGEWLGRTFPLDRLPSRV
jgi:hypothetical protein